jgi:hypothetical protein
MEQRFGLRIVVGYAMSESPYGLIWPHGTRPYGTLGTPRQHPALGVVNEAKVIGPDGEVLPSGETGELLLRNPVVTPGYWGMPTETAEAITADGWLHTGDLVTRNDDGTYTFVARKKEVLRRRGENLSPAEVEEALMSHPSVLEAAVVGVPSELSEEEVKAFVVPTLTSPRCGPTPRRCSRRTRCPATGRPSRTCPAPRPPGWPSTGCRGTTPRTSGTRRPTAPDRAAPTSMIEPRSGRPSYRLTTPRQPQARGPGCPGLSLCSKVFSGTGHSRPGRRAS